MQVLSYALPFLNIVNIDIKQGRTNHFYFSQTGFLSGFPHGNSNNVTLTIRMPTRLQPEIQLTMMRQQGTLERGVQQPCRTRDVTDSQFTPKAVIMVPDEILQAGNCLMLLGVIPKIISQKRQDPGIVHGSGEFL